MKTVRFLAELTYDPHDMHGYDEEAQAFFLEQIVGANPESDSALMLFSNEMGDTIGAVRVIEFDGKPVRTVPSGNGVGGA